MSRCLVAFLAVGACGGGSTSPLVGSWLIIWPAGSPNAAVHAVYSFDADKKLHIDESTTDASSGCVNDTKNEGTWSESGGSVTTTLVSGTSSVTDCINQAQDVAEHPLTGIDTTPKTFAYSISGSTLTLSGPGGAGGTFMRQ